MIPLRTMTPLPSAKQTSAAASKIKNKLLNTSSFFKVSLKNNNKALAVALEVQKERNRQLEKDIVFLQKQVEALCFELATKKYKHRKLLLILKNLHSNTLQHLDMVADLFSNSDLPKLSEDTAALSGDVHNEKLLVTSLSDHLAPQPDISEVLLVASEKETANSPKKDILNIQSTLQPTTDDCKDKTNSEKRASSVIAQSSLTGTSRPFSSLRDEVERLSMKISQSGFNIKSVPSSLISQTSAATCVNEKPKPPLIDDVPHPSSSDREPERGTGNYQENTVLLNTTMEMTISNPAQIVTVETKANKQKAKKRKEQGLKATKSPKVKTLEGSESTVQSYPLQANDCVTEARKDPEIIVSPWPETQKKIIVNSRIPKLDNNNQKKAKKKIKSHDSTESKTESADVLQHDMEDYFTNPDIRVSKARENLQIPAEDNTEEEPRPRITCRRTRTKGRRASSFIRRTFVTLPSRESEISRADVEDVCNEVQDVLQRKYDAGQEVKQPDELPTGAEEAELPDSEHFVERQSTTNPGVAQKPRCRGTFVVSVARESFIPGREFPPLDVSEQDWMPSAETSICEVEKAPAVNPELSPSRQCDGAFQQTAAGSCKRSWLATQESESPPEESGSRKEAEQLEEEHTAKSEFQKPKKARREEANPSRKKKAKKESSEQQSDRRKKKKKKEGFREALSLCEGDKRHGEPLHQLQEIDLNSKDDKSEYLSPLKPERSRKDGNPKRSRETTKLQRKNLRETFIVYERKSQDTVPLDEMMSESYGLMGDGLEARHQNVGNLLTDEMPPWLTMDVSTADTEVGSAPATPRRETQSRMAGINESAEVSARASPAGRVLTSLTNISTPDSEAGGRTRRRHGVVSYKEPALNSKMRRGDKFTDSMFLSSPVFKNSKKTKNQQKKTKQEQPIFTD